MRASRATRRPGRLIVVLLVVAGVVLTLAQVAGAKGRYDLKGSWKVAGTGGGATGVVVITSFNRSTGKFSGTSYNGMFKVRGVETGKKVSFTQSEPGYVSHDSATLTANGTKMAGRWHDSNGAGGTWHGTKQKPKSKSKSKKS